MCNLTGYTFKQVICPTPESNHFITKCLSRLVAGICSK
jgi:hypothetical protein